MSKYVHAGYWIVIIILIVVAVNIGASLDSERSKRIELEAELKSVVTDYLEVGEHFGIDPDMISCLRERYNISVPDSLLAVPTKDLNSRIAETLKRLREAPEGARLDPYGIDSSEVADSTNLYFGGVSEVVDSDAF